MQITELELENFRCYKKLNLELDSRLTVVVGENGKGKTAVFDAIRMALAPAVEAFGFEAVKLLPKDSRRVPVYDEGTSYLVAMEHCWPVTIAMKGKTAVGQEFSSLLQAEEDGQISFSGNLGQLSRKFYEALKQDESKQLPVLAYYGTDRIWADSRLFITDESRGRFLGYEEALEPTSSYHTFSKWFMEKSNDDSGVAARQAVVEALNTCMRSTGLQNLRYNYALDTLVIEHPDFGELLVDDLSDGTRSIITMVADLAYRMSCLNPQLGENTIKETEGLVLIDEVDMHLHPLWQQTILYDLLEAFPKVQFLVTTHSPQVLSTVPAHCIRAIYWDKGESMIKTFSFSLGAETSQILEQVQNVGSRPEFLPIVKELQEYLELVRLGEWDSERAKELRAKLDKWAQGNEPALLRADMEIRLQQLRSRRK